MSLCVSACVYLCCLCLCGYCISKANEKNALNDMIIVLNYKRSFNKMYLLTYTLITDNSISYIFVYITAH